MVDFDRILATKMAAQSRLMALPGVHAVGVGPKIVKGKPTGEPAIIVLVPRKKPLSELKPHEVVPAEIDGIKTDVIEAEPARTLAAPPENPDEDGHWDIFGNITLMGGMQIQAAVTTFGGTLGCVAKTTEPDPKIVAITCQHVVDVRPGRRTDLLVDVSQDQHTMTFTGSNTPGTLLVASMKVLPAAGGAGQDLDAFWVSVSLHAPLGRPAVGSSAQLQMNLGCNSECQVEKSNKESSELRTMRSSRPELAHPNRQRLTSAILRLTARRQ